MFFLVTIFDRLLVAYDIFLKQRDMVMYLKNLALMLETVDLILISRPFMSGQMYTSKF